MSRSSYTVTFADGTVKHGLHNNSIDAYWPALYDSNDEAWGEQYAAYRSGDWPTFERLAFPPPVGEHEPVTVCLDDAEAHPGVATHNALISVEQPGYVGLSWSLDFW